jgi:hypothetical protein
MRAQPRESEREREREREREKERKGERKGYFLSLAFHLQDGRMETRLAKKLGNPTTK